MKPPPATPTPRRFLTKRPAASSSQLPHSTPTSMRFQSTPRFGATQTRQMEEVDEMSSPPPAQSSAAVDGRDMVSDSIEVDSYADSLASQAEGEPRSSCGSSEVEMEDDRSRMGYASDENEVDEEDAAVGAPAERWDEETGSPPVKRRRLSGSASPTRLRMLAAYDADTGHYENIHYEAEHDDVQDRTRTRPPAQQPTFQPAPRFKPLPEDELLTHPDHSGPAGAPLAAPLSPRRRGAPYLAGGLAAQLQGLLSDVKGAEGGDGAIVRLRVEEARPGARMHLVRGRVLSRGVEGAGSEVQRYILAGGNGVRMVAEGCVLRIVPAPAWDVHLGEKWTVACDWSVESG